MDFVSAAEDSVCSRTIWCTCCSRWHRCNRFLQTTRVHRRPPPQWQVQVQMMPSHTTCCAVTEMQELKSKFKNHTIKTFSKWQSYLLSSKCHIKQGNWTDGPSKWVVLSQNTLKTGLDFMLIIKNLAASVRPICLYWQRIWGRSCWLFNYCLNKQCHLMPAGVRLTV